MLGMQTWCRGWKATSNSLGRTSKPQVSVATPATSMSCSQSAVVKDRPGESPPAGPGEPAGAHQQQVTAADPGTVALGSDRGLEVLGRDGEPVGEFAVGAD